MPQPRLSTLKSRFSARKCAASETETSSSSAWSNCTLEYLTLRSTQFNICTGISAWAQLSSFLQLLIELQNKPHIPPDETLGIMFQNHQSGYCRKAINNLKNKIIFLRIISALHQCEKEDERNILILQAESIVKSGFRGGGCSNLRKWAKALLNGYA